MEVNGQIYAPTVFPRERARDIHCIGDWVDPRSGLNIVAKGKISLHFPSAHKV